MPLQLGKIGHVWASYTIHNIMVFAPLLIASKILKTV
jgi:hypothetical protein